MILPLPVPVGSSDDAVTFIDLSVYPQLFDDLVKGLRNFPARREGWSGRPGYSGGVRGRIAVVGVGDFEASFVPSISDLDRLDPCFRLPTEIWSQLPSYERWGFAVFKLKSGHQRIHPMAFAFPRANPGELFFPTVHIHDGEVRPVAHFDHALFCQRSALIRRDDWPGKEWTHSTAARDFVDIDKAGGLIDGARHVYRRRIQGRAPNRDVHVED